jgi:16S rRNA (cytosine1402-N4)-methyltransferase
VSGPFVHEPVLLAECVEVLSAAPAGRFVDATVGGAGHAEAVLTANHGLELLGLDQDGAALDAARARLTSFGDRVQLVRTRFDRLAEVLAGIDDLPVTAIFFDLGVSSPQLDVADRGFSYRADGPIDMRMDDRQSTSASDLVNDLAAGDLADLLRRFGDERHAMRIARAIVAARPIERTAQLAEVVRDAVPAAARRRGGHPATRTFQALRIATNDELGALVSALDQALDVLAPEGRCAVLTYHSGEDRIVKRRFAAACRGPHTPRGVPVKETPVGPYAPLTRSAVRAAPAEIERNPRARSARLRAVQRRGELARSTP